MSLNFRIAAFKSEAGNPSDLEFELVYSEFAAELNCDPPPSTTGLAVV